MPATQRRSTAAAAAVALAGLVAAPCLLFAGPRSPAASRASVGRQATDVDVEAWEKVNIVDEKAMLAKSEFPIKPDELIKKAKTFLAYQAGCNKPELIGENFEFVGPVVGPLPKAAFLKALAGFDLASAFPDMNPEFHDFRVDPFEPSRVWMTARGYGTNSQDGTAPLLKKKTGNKYVNPPQACSLRFNPDGLVNQYTIGYVMDRRLGNTGGLGGIYGILYAIGKPLPFPEANPWKKSLRYALFQKVGAFLQKLQDR